jgi:hypothetical protein
MYIEEAVDEVVEAIENLINATVRDNPDYGNYSEKNELREKLLQLFSGRKE